MKYKVVDDRYFDGFNDGLLVAWHMTQEPLEKVRKSWDEMYWNINPVRDNLKRLEERLKEGRKNEG